MTRTTAPREEIRFAVILNGGVSLAVWMGGTVLELDRLTRGRGPYRALLDLVAGTARVDVVSGTSAGGINGACLALSQVNAAADLSVMRDLWTEHGRLESLLRDPFRGSPPSVLRGDEFFLPRLAEAMHRLARPFRPFTADSRPVDLTITTTLLHGARSVTVDALGTHLPQSVHEGSFRFRRDPDGADPERRDDFREASIDATAARLALAARTTAGFPIAFEPSFIRVHTPPGTEPIAGSPPLAPGEDPLSPDMSGVASWRTAGPAAEIPADRSRFAVDGGLLANTPTRAALAGIARMPASAQVRRVALLVYPHAPLDVPDPGDSRDRMPDVRSATASILTALTSQGSRTFVEEIEAHNRTARTRRGSRTDILTACATGSGSGSGHPDTSGQVHALAASLHDHYRLLRMRRSAQHLAGRSRIRQGWSFERMTAATRAAHQEWFRRSLAAGHSPALPQVPDVPAGDPTTNPPAAGDPPGWGWGFTVAEGICVAAIDLLDRMAQVLPWPGADGVGADQDGPRAVRAARLAVDRSRTRLRRLEQQTDRIWDTDRALADLEPNRGYWTIRLAVYQHLMVGLPEPPTGPGRFQEALTEVTDTVREQATDTGLSPENAEARTVAVADTLRGLTVGPPRELGTQVRDLVTQATAAVGGVLEVLAGLVCPDTLPEETDDLSRWSALLPVGTTPEQVLARLRSLEIATWCLTDDVPSGAEYPVELVQLSLQAENPFAVVTRTADDKVGGMALARFGGFLKQSWRVNDWTWGRLDAASTLCRILLAPSRLRRVAQLDGRLQPLSTYPDPDQATRELAEQVVRDLVIALFADPDQVPAPARALIPAAVADLAEVYRCSGDTGDLPPSVPALADLAAWALHLRIAAEELPALARAVRADRFDGAGPRCRGELFLRQEEDLLAELESLPPAPAALLPDPPDRTARAVDPEHLADDPPDPHLARRLQLGLRALTALDRAGIGREPLAEEGTSDQLLRTAASALGVAVAVADGSRSGLGALRPLTRALRGAALLPCWTVTGLTRGGSLVRQLSLLCLALGGALTALALLGVLPDGWSGPAAATGGCTLLAAFGYGALRSRSLLHSVVLLSPIVPLLLFAGSRVAEGFRTDAAARAGTGVLAVLALLCGLMALGSLPAPMDGPVRTLLRLLDRTADGMGLPPVDRHRRRRALGRLVLRSALVTGIAVAVVALTRLLWRGTPDLVARVGDHPGTVAVGTVVLFTAGALLAGQGGRGLRRWRPTERRSGTGQTSRRHWVVAPLGHPSGVTAGWSVLYGTGYLLTGLAAAAVHRHTPVPMSAEPLGWAGVALTCELCAVVLLLVVPVGAPLLTRARIGRIVVAEADRHSYPRTWIEGPGALDAELLERLSSRDMAYTYLCTSSADGRSLRLRPAGRRLRSRVARALDHQRSVQTPNPRVGRSRVRIPRPATSPENTHTKSTSNTTTRRA